MFSEVGSAIERALLVSAGFCDYYCKSEEIEMHKLIWLRPITIVSIRIVLINEAALVVTVPLHSFVAAEYQNHCYCSGFSAYLLMQKLLKSA